ncbi:MAG: protein kinase [Ignavibacteriales bacterium]|nr:MAG: protein kinase [Ignavibacteriales bacterium]
MIGSTVEHYKIMETLGEGGMGIVYKAFDLKLERYVALKILGAQAITNPRFIERFKREAKNQAKLSHPNIVTVYGFTEVNNTFGIAMEYIPGETLDDLVERLGKIDLLTSLKIIKQVLAGCSYSHNKGFIHRDIKPSNVIIGNDGIAKIMDFGISKSLTEGKGITKTGAKLGTILYMSPEQFKGQEPTRQSDIYSIGCTLYEMVLGNPPFDLASEFEIMEAHLKREPVPPSELLDNIPTALDAIINKALSKNEQKRYHSCDEFMHDINQLITRVEHLKPRSKISRKLRKPLKIKYVVLPIIIIILLGILFAYVLNETSFLWRSGKPQREPSQILNGNSSVINSMVWEKIDINSRINFSALCALNDSLIFLCGDNGSLLRSENFGHDWTSVTDSSGIFLTDIEFVNEKTGFVVGDNGLFLYSNDGGYNWNQKQIGIDEQISCIKFFDGSKIGFITTSEGRIFRTKNLGESWNQVHKRSGRVLYSLFMITELDGIAVGWDGLILRTSNGGESWIDVDKITDKYIRDINFHDKQNGILVCGGGEIFITTNGGDDWNSVSSGIITGLTSVPLFTPEHSIVLSSTGEILYSQDFGRTWMKSSSNSFVPLNDGIILPDGSMIIAGNAGTLLKSQIPLIDFTQPNL